MKILIAPDSFKESLSAKEVTEIIADTFLSELKNVEIIKTPMADGGEETSQTLTEATNGIFLEKLVKDPLGREIKARYGISGDRETAIIEMATCCGLALLSKEERNPSITTTYGLGELIKDALDRGIREFIIGIGGSATNDAGAGMLQALGFGLKDNVGNEIGFGGYELEKVEKIVLGNADRRLKDSKFLIACDVANPMVGENGASFVYGPQKGANQEMVNKLDRSLRHFADKIKETTGRDVSNIPGSGAAGGIGGAFVAFLDATLKPGFEIVSNFQKLEEKIREADIVISGEGRTDHQTQFGKVVSGVSKLCKKYDKPLICVSGSYTKDVEVLYDYGMTAIFSCIHKPDDLNQILQNAKENLRMTAKNIARLINRLNKEKAP